LDRRNVFLWFDLGFIPINFVVSSVLSEADALDGSSHAIHIVAIVFIIILHILLTPSLRGVISSWVGLPNAKFP